MFAFSLSFVSLSVGCGSGKNTVNEDTRSSEQVDADFDELNKQMEEDAANDNPDG